MRGVLQTRNRLIVSGVVGLILTYFLGSRAIYTGSYWQYFGTLILLALSVKLLVKAFNVPHGESSRRGDPGKNGNK